MTISGTVVRRRALKGRDRMSFRAFSRVAPALSAVGIVLIARAACAGQTAPVTSPPSAASTADATQQAAAPAPQAPAPQGRVPIVNRANDRLPGWLRVRGEFRERIEGPRGIGFAQGRDDGFALSRVRFNVSVTPSPNFRVQAELHDARVAGKDIGPTAAPFRGPFDIRTAFADIGSAKAPATLRVGRQELAFGEQRLLGHLAWVNTGRVWDGTRLTLRSKPVQVDLFGASLVRFLPSVLDRSGNGNRLLGAYASTTTLVPGATVEPYVLLRRDENLRSELGPTGTLDQSTTGVRMAGKLPARLDYGIEMAMQRGSLADDSLSAWAGHYQLRASLPGRGAVKIITEYNRASGDRNPTDGVRQTFDQLYPTGHDKLGLGDQVGWKNVHHLREGVDFMPLKATPISLSYHTWWLAERTDGLYSATGALLARVPAGAASSHIGHEIDVQISRPLTPQLGLAVGYAHMFSGAFLKQATPGASFSHSFVMVTYAFLAEK